MKRAIIAIITCLGLIGTTGCSLEQAMLLDDVKQIEGWQCIDVSGAFEINKEDFYSQFEEKGGDDYQAKTSFQGYFNFADEEAQLLTEEQIESGQAESEAYYIKGGYFYRAKDNYSKEKQSIDKLDATYIGVLDNACMRHLKKARTWLTELTSVMSKNELSLPVCREGKSLSIDLASEAEIAEFINSLYRAGYVERKEVAKILAEIYIDQHDMAYLEPDADEDQHFMSEYYDLYMYGDGASEKEADGQMQQEENEQKTITLTREQKIEQVATALIEGWEKYCSDGEIFEMSKLILKGNLLGSHAKLEVTPKGKGYLFKVEAVFSTVEARIALKGTIDIQEAEKREIKLPTGSKALSQEEKAYYLGKRRCEQAQLIEEQEVSEEALRFWRVGITRGEKRYYNPMTLKCEIYEKEGRYYLEPTGGYAYVHLVNGIKQGKIKGYLEGNKPIISCEPMVQTLSDGDKLYFIDEETLKALNFDIVKLEVHAYEEHEDNRCYYSIYYDFPISKEEREALYQAYYNYVDAIFKETTSLN